MEGLSASIAQRVATNLDQPPLSHSLANPTRSKEGYHLVRGGSGGNQREEHLRDKSVHRQNAQSQDTKIQVKL
jgi:hypothetical protein